MPAVAWAQEAAAATIQEAAGRHLLAVAQPMSSRVVSAHANEGSLARCSGSSWHRLAGAIPKSLQHTCDAQEVYNSGPRPLPRFPPACRVSARGALPWSRRHLDSARATGRMDNIAEPYGQQVEGMAVVRTNVERREEFNGMGTTHGYHIAELLMRTDMGKQVDFEMRSRSFWEQVVGRTMGERAGSMRDCIMTNALEIEVHFERRIAVIALRVEEAGSDWAMCATRWCRAMTSRTSHSAHASLQRAMPLAPGASRHCATASRHARTSCKRSEKSRSWRIQRRAIGPAPSPRWELSPELGGGQ